MMLSMHKQIVLSLADIHHVSVGCPHCATKVLLDLRKKSEHAEKYGTLLTNQCPGCRKSYDSALGQAVTALQQAYDSLCVESVQPWISFQVSSEDGISA
jgi:hypothetical protein